MFSTFDTVFKSRFRHTETLDTRLGIHRHEENPEHKKRTRKDQDGRPAADEDIAIVSIDALIPFLQELLPPDFSPVESPRFVPAAPHAAHPPQDPHARSALRAYERGSGEAAAATRSPAPLRPSALPELTAEEVRIIRSLLPRLHLLRTQGKRDLPLPKAQTFLQSLAAAVEQGTATS